VYKIDYAFRMNVMEEIFEIRSCMGILANDIKVDTTCTAVEQVSLYQCQNNETIDRIHTGAELLCMVKYIQTDTLGHYGDARGIMCKGLKTIHN